MIISTTYYNFMKIGWYLGVFIIYIYSIWDQDHWLTLHDASKLPPFGVQNAKFRRSKLRSGFERHFFGVFWPKNSAFEIAFGASNAIFCFFLVFEKFPNTKIWRSSFSNAKFWRSFFFKLGVAEVRLYYVAVTSPQQSTADTRNKSNHGPGHIIC